MQASVAHPNSSTKRQIGGEHQTQDITAAKSFVKADKGGKDNDKSDDAEFDVGQILPDEADNEVANISGVNDSYECDDLPQFAELLKSKIKDLTTDNTEELKITEILSQNTKFAKSAIHILSVEESNVLFCKVALIISQYPNSFHQDFAFIRNIKVWLKWLLILRGSVITQNEESIEYLKLLQSELKQGAKNLNNLIKLTGKLTLLSDQLSVRDGILNNTENSHYEEEESDGESNITNGNSTSVVLDGEGGFDDDLDIDSDNNSNASVNADSDAEDDEE
ncbi:hypothetical protein CANINC_002841 [Pichia inconspicua]|uniref:Small-subunit processome Utp12 domain-containing protein n=1 Tax=Pichia inconspicua TaxID=52247 RepID=A0A4T0X038_9ASCO|nr:hypothetical protein CANINC_002841 [[Candida] inconspicua]